MDHQDVEWSLTLVIQHYQLRLVEQICNSQVFAQRYVPLSAVLPANKFQAKKDDSIVQCQKHTHARYLF